MASDGSAGTGGTTTIAPGSGGVPSDGSAGAGGTTGAGARDGQAPDQPQIFVPGCGDGRISASEQCDDGNTAGGDGCSASCRVEPGFKCAGEPSVCAATVCGDGVKEGSETCDDGNQTPFDGCSEECRLEPNCSVGSGCTSVCGDGLVIGEECDDGNLIDGDGCSSACKVEPGWTCQQPAIGNKMSVPAIYRDFRAGNPADFEAGASGSFNATAGIVSTTLNDKGKPVLSASAPSSGHVTSADTFAQWYTDTAGVNATIPGQLVLWANGSGGYVNRYGANGEQWNNTMPANSCGTEGMEALDSTGAPIPCTSKATVEHSIDAGTGLTDCEKLEQQGYVQLAGSCHLDNGTYKAAYVVSKADGQPLFFPVDGDPFTPTSELLAAQIPPFYDPSTTWPYDLDSAGNKRQHNFSFTSEIRYYFRYDKTKSYTLEFVGDDDLWVFINGKLAADVGGIHVAVIASIAIGADGNAKTTITATYQPGQPTTSTKMSAALGLQDGVVYEIAIFQAERQSTSSSLKVTLPPFSTSPSQCTPL